MTNLTKIQLKSKNQFYKILKSKTTLIIKIQLQFNQELDKFKDNNFFPKLI